MFTGIVEETGEVLAASDEAGGRRLRLSTSFDDLERGGSVSVSGACLTVEDHGERAGGDGGRDGGVGGADDGSPGVTDRPRWFSVFIAAETVDRTYLGTVAVGDRVNLERAMPADGRFDGHVVQGHVDATAEVLAVDRVGDDWRAAFTLPASLRPYLVEKGSITVDGISLTVAGLDDESFEAAIIPETDDLTNLSAKTPGDPVHLEVDVIAKYVESLLEGY
jgi:riboflavin synthase